MNKETVVIDSDLRDLIPGFINKRQTDIKSIQTAADNEDYESIRIVGHTLKGIGGGYGFERITMLGAAIEQAAKIKDGNKARELAHRLKEYLELIEIRYE
ncbi:Hpt domain-containing protein [Sporomusa aerivorans]|uniref:Hpt domain-containing protein n=1 Tax=Sporomusa aerivorans TaxID=204936 RepID=UPI003529FCEA